MVPDADILTREGFRRIGGLKYELELSTWWNETSAQLLVALRAGHGLLLRGSKSYTLESIAEEGETWARDIAPFHDYLKAHLPEAQLSLSTFRDVPAFLADRQAKNRLRDESPIAATNAPSLSQAKTALERVSRLRELESGDSSLLSEHLRRLETSKRAEIEQLRTLAEGQATRQDLIRRVQGEYRHKSSAVCLIFSVPSVVQLARTREELVTSARAIVQELKDIDRFQIRQVLCGGKLRLKIAESREPVLSMLELWLGGALNPTQLGRLRAVAPVNELSRHTAVFPDEDIAADGVVIDRRKALAPRAIAALIGSLPRTGAVRARPISGPVLYLGKKREHQELGGAVKVPLLELGHVYISGMTGTGKSIFGRVLTEECAEHIHVLVLDPRNQSAGLLLPQDQPQFLERYAEFDMAKPRGLAFRYFAPGVPSLPQLPSGLSTLANARSVVSLKGLNDAQRCDRFRQCLDSAFESLMERESEAVRLVILIEEAQLFTQRLVNPEAKEAAKSAEAALDRLLREGRKFGLRVLLSSQSIKDFARDAATIRQNTTTKVFFGNSDREIEYARDYLSDPRDLARLGPGEALLCNPALGVIPLMVRPTYSKVWDLSVVETQAVLGKKQKAALTEGAAKLLQAIQASHAQGQAPNMSQAAAAAGITSRRKLHALINELSAAGLIRTRQLRDQGKPRVIEPLGLGPGHNADTSGQEPADVGPATS